MKNGGAKWVVIHIAHSEERAARASELLEREGFLVRVNPIARSITADPCFEVQALSCEAQEARDLLQENGF